MQESIQNNQKKNPTLKNNTFRSLLDSSGGSGGFGIISSSGEKVTDICINVEYVILRLSILFNSI